ncbi:MFS transporter [Isoptericola halotolerans]|uniref:MFS transporter n=1 Tax=Isoptericola halotolerans TaxID=300560 RepID=UPI0038910CC0
MTGPGQTVGISLFIDPLIAELGMSRSAVSTAYLLGTLAGAVALPWIGRALDRFGVRRTMALVGLVFGGVLVALSAVSSIVGLTAGFVGVRMAGQGALGLTATTVVALWFDRRRGLVTGLVGAVGAVGISMTPLLLEGLMAEHGWRTAWLVEGLAVWAVVLPLALIAMRDRPERLGQRPDGAAPPHDGSPPPQPGGLTRSQVVRHPAFWLIASAVAVSGLLTTAVAFHQISLLTARGLTAAEAAANFIPQTVAGLLATLVTGYLIDRFPPRWTTVASMLSLAAALW